MVRALPVTSLAPLLALAAALTAGCAYFTRAFACVDDAGCLDGQRCVEGACTTVKDAADAGPGEGEGDVAGEGEAGEGEAGEGEAGEGEAGEGEGEGDAAEGEGEGEGEDCTPLYADTFDLDDVRAPFVIFDAPDGDISVVGGRFVMSFNGASAPTVSAQANFDVRDTVFTTEIADPPENPSITLIPGGAFNPDNFSDCVFISVQNHRLRLTMRENGVDKASHNVSFNPIDHRVVRVRFLDATSEAVLEASADGVTFVEVTRVPASSANGASAGATPAYWANATLAFGGIGALFNSDFIALDSVLFERDECR